MIGIGIALVVYGLYVGLFIAWAYTLRSKYFKNGLINGSMMILFVLVTAATLLNFINIYRSFVTLRDTEGTLTSLAVYANPLTEASGTLFYVSASITESLLMWRLWVVWRGRVLVCVVPAIIFCSYVLSGAGLVATTFLEARPNGIAYTKLKGIFPPLTALILLFQNLLVSTLISARLWWMGKTISRMSANKDKGRLYSRIISAIVESAALYALTFMIFAIFRVLGMANSSWIILMLGPVMTGLTPTMIDVLFTVF
ncbi:hypothetical protein FRB94_003206 [Tulasnella sp. JGI-2019a]|nr:hypothetical protein FRB94_003206 [Tulasnella sp. JGI-2019a]